MSLYLRLLRVQMNQRFGFSQIRAGLKTDRLRTLGRGAILLIAILSIASLVGFYTWLLTLIMPMFSTLGLENVLLGLVLLVAMFFVFFMGLFYLLGMLFFAKDTEFLASLPIPQGTVFAAKFTQVMLGELATALALLLPAFIVYGISAQADVFFWIRALLVALSAPCIPLAISALLSLLLMRFNALWRRRDLLTVVGSILLLVGVFAFQGLIQSVFPEDMSQQAVIAMISDSSSILRQVVSAFPPAGWAAQGLMGDGGMLALFLGVSVVSMALVIWLAGRIYYGGAMAQLETASSRKSVSFIGKSVRRHSALYALFMREWRTVLRSPIYMLNGLIMIIMGPILLIFPKIIQGGSGGAEMDALFSLLESSIDSRIILLVLAALFLLLSLTSPASSTALSREGGNFYLLRTIPVTPVRQVMAKFLFGYSIALLATVVTGLAALLIFGFSPALVLWSMLLGMVACVAPLALSILPDILRPKLTWNSETEAIKQNLNGILGIVIGWAYLALIGFGVYKAIAAGLDITLVIIAVTGLSILLGAGALYVLGMTAKRSWRAIEG